MSLEKFNLTKGKTIGGRYIVDSQLGAGWEGEVYKVKEILTGIYRAVKIFYPERNKLFKVSTRYAKKLHKLSECPIIMNYHAQELIKIKGKTVACLVCELIEGEMLSHFVDRHKNKKLGIFQALHLLYALANGVESIHRGGEYHGDLHLDNVIIRRFGLEFDIKIIDLHHWGDSKKDNRDEDLIKMIRVFYDILGGQKRYAGLPPSIKYIICGLKRSLILQRFKTVTALKMHLETMDWSDAYTTK